jgi:hypothetical protein
MEALSGSEARVLAGDSWDRMLEQGIQLLNRFCQDDIVRIHQPRHNLQINSL